MSKPKYGEKGFDASDWAEVVYCPVTDMIGVKWPYTWLGGVIWFDNPRPELLVCNQNCIFDDEPGYKTFEKVCDL